MEIDSLKRLDVLEARTMGPGTAQCFAAAGYDVMIWSKDTELLPKAKR